VSSAVSANRPNASTMYAMSAPERPRAPRAAERAETGVIATSGVPVRVAGADRFAPRVLAPCEPAPAVVGPAPPDGRAIEDGAWLSGGEGEDDEDEEGEEEVLEGPAPFAPPLPPPGREPPPISAEPMIAWLPWPGPP